MAGSKSRQLHTVLIMNKLRCPKCGMIFDIMYARTASCMGCPMSTFGECGYVKCPRCGYEGKYEEFTFT